MKNKSLPQGLIKKKYRKIIVRDELFAWRMQSWGIRILHVESQKEILGSFKWDPTIVPHPNKEGIVDSGSVIGREYVITPSYIRKVIDYTFSKEWKREDNFPVELDDNIPFDGVWAKYDFPELKDLEVAIIGYEGTSRRKTLLDINFNEFNGEASLYRLFPNVELARSYCIEQCGQNPLLQFWIFEEEESAIGFVSHNSVLHFNI